MILTMQPDTNIDNGYYPKSDTCVMIRFNFSDGELEGEFRHIYMDTVQTFQTVSELIYRLELMLEEINLPSADFQCRKEWDINSSRKYGAGVPRKPLPNFMDKPSFHGMEAPGEQFFLHIRYRRHSTWQGDCRWLNEKRSFAFRSTLELLMLLEGFCLEQKATS